MVFTKTRTFDKQAYKSQMATKETPKNPSSLDGVPDLCQLMYLGESNVLHNLDYRYEKQQIYTSTTAKVLVAVNPYESVKDNDSERTMAKYQAAPVDLEGLLHDSKLPPHIFTVAHATYHNMLSFKQNQSVVVCGESGAGKTESAKLLMKFLAYTSTVSAVEPSEHKEAESVGKQVLDANPILETFGNAKTVLNNNSSRFGKFTKMLFEPTSDPTRRKLAGAAIETYLLEKSRVVRQDKGERNYHVFYQMAAHAKRHPEWKMGDGNPEQFNYLNQSGCTTLDGQGSARDEHDFKVLIDSMNTLDIPKEQQDQVFRCCAAILHLGNIQFEQLESSSEASKVDEKTRASLNNAAELFQLDAAQTEKRLITRTIKVRGSTIVKPLAKGDAEYNRDCMSRAIYNGLFRWIVARINEKSMSPITEDTKWVGTLDVFGFEIFEHNSFEQFCINFANERLQQFFNFHVLKAEQELYRREALIWTPIDLPDNQDVIDLIMGVRNGRFQSTPGILNLLDTACMQPKGNDKVFTQILFDQHNNHPRLEKATRANSSPDKRRRGSQFEMVNGFKVCHYAGEVMYNAKQFLLKNADSTHPDTQALFSESKCPIVSRVMTLKATGGSAKSRRGSSAFISTSNVFATQLDSLMNTLAETTPFFVRCIKPNGEKKPKHFVPEYVRPQLRCGGLVEALRIIKCGFPTRCSYERIFKQFGCILPEGQTPHNLNKRDFTEAIINVLGNTEGLMRTEYQLGLTMIFFKPGKQQFFNKILEINPKSVSSSEVSAIRKFLVHKRIVRCRGTIKAYVRTQHVIRFIKLQKAARVMVVIAKTFGRALQRARAKISGKKAEALEVRRLKDQKYQDALKAVKELEAMKHKEKQMEMKLRMEKEAAAAAKQAILDSEKQTKDFMAKNKKMNQRIVELEDALETEKFEHSSTKNERSLLDQQLAAAKTSAGDIGAQITSLRQQMAQADTRHKRAVAELESAREKDSVSWREREEELKKERDGQATEMAHVQQQLSLLTDRHQMDMAEAEKTLSSSKRRASELEEEIEGLRESTRRGNKESGAREEELMRELSTTKSTISQLEIELTSTADSLKQLQYDSEQSLRQARADHDQEVTSLKNAAANAATEASQKLREQEMSSKEAQSRAELDANTLRRRIEELETELARYKDRVGKLGADADDREQSLLDEVRSAEEAARKSAEQYERRIRDSENELMELNNKFMMATGQIEAAQAKIASQMENAESASEAFEAEKRRRDEDARRRESQLDADISEVRAKFEKERLESQRLEGEIREAKSAATRLQTDARREAEQAGSTEATLKRSLTNLENELSVRTRDAETTGAALEELRMDLVNKESQWRSANNDLQMQLTSVEGRARASEDEVEGLNDIVKKLRKEIRDVEVKASRGATEKDLALETAETQLSQLQSNMQQLTTVHQKLIADHNEVRSQQEQLMRDLNKARNNVDLASHDAATNASQVERLSRQLQESEDSREQSQRVLREQINALQAQTSNLQDELEDAENKVRQQATAWKEEREALLNNTNVSDELRAQHEHELSSMKSSMSNAQLQFQEEIDSLTSEKNNLDIRVRELERKNKSLARQIAEAEEEREENEDEHQDEMDQLKAKMKKNAAKFQAELQSARASNTGIAPAELQKYKIAAERATTDAADARQECSRAQLELRQANEQIEVLGEDEARYRKALKQFRQEMNGKIASDKAKIDKLTAKVKEYKNKSTMDTGSSRYQEEAAREHRVRKEAEASAARYRVKAQEMEQGRSFVASQLAQQKKLLQNATMRSNMEREEYETKVTSLEQELKTAKREAKKVAKKLSRAETEHADEMVCLRMTLREVQAQAQDHGSMNTDGSYGEPEMTNSNLDFSEEQKRWSEQEERLESELRSTREELSCANRKLAAVVEEKGEIAERAKAQVEDHEQSLRLRELETKFEHEGAIKRLQRKIESLERDLSAPRHPISPNHTPGRPHYLHKTIEEGDAEHDVSISSESEEGEGAEGQ